MTADAKRDAIAVVPVAGAGTRLRPHTFSAPKPLLPVAGNAILGHLVQDLLDAGLTEAVFIIGHMGDRIRAFIEAEYVPKGLQAHFVEQAVARGLGHAIHLAAPVVGERRMLILLGDTIVRADLAGVLRRDVNAIGVKEVADPRRFGVVELDGERVRRLVEKPDVPPTNLAIVGIYYFRESAALFGALDELVQGGQQTKGEFQLTDALQRLLDRGHDLTTFPVEGWYDCGKTETLLETNRILLEQQSRTVEIPGSLVVPPVALGEGAVVENSIIGPHVSVGEGAVVRRTIVKDSILFDAAQVEDCVLESSLVGRGAKVRGAVSTLNVGDTSEARLA